MSVFGTYSKYYNLLYSDKDYSSEAQYVHEIIKKYLPGAVSVLDLGCGTGRHDFELAKFGYKITGVDISEEMLVAARSRLPVINAHSSTLNFLPGDIRDVRLNQTFDVVVSLFHVMSYQISNEDLQAVFSTARLHLNPGGLFIFDCWYGPAVLTDPPVVKIKRLEDGEISVIRIAEPIMRYNKNVVDVNYEVLITDKGSGSLEQLQEIHRMRYLFLPEIARLYAESKMIFLKHEELVTKKESSVDTWSICCIGATANE